MSMIRLTMLALGLVLAAPEFARAQAATCQDFADCFRNSNSPCDSDDLLAGLTFGAVDGIGDLLCFLGNTKCGCFRAVTNENSSEFDEFQNEVERIVAQCDGAGSSGRALSGIAFEAANAVCTPTFSDVEPILSAACGTCHIAGNSGNFNFANGRSDLVNVPSLQSSLPYVAPGNTANSYLFAKITNTQFSVGGSGAQMPLGAMLPQTDIDILAEWIAGGAQP